MKLLQKKPFAIGAGEARARAQPALRSLRASASGDPTRRRSQAPASIASRRRAAVAHRTVTPSRHQQWGGDPPVSRTDFAGPGSGSRSPGRRSRQTVPAPASSARRRLCGRRGDPSWLDRRLHCRFRRRTARAEELALGRGRAGILRRDARARSGCDHRAPAPKALAVPWLRRQHSRLRAGPPGEASHGRTDAIVAGQRSFARPRRGARRPDMDRERRQRRRDRRIL